MWQRLKRYQQFRTLAALLIASSLVIAGCGGSPEPAQSDDPGDETLMPVKYMRVGQSATTWPLMIGEELGFFEKHGVDLEILQTSSSSSVSQAIVTGSAHLGSGGVVDLVRPILQGADMELVATGVAHPPFSVVVDESIGSWSDLEGKTVAVDSAKGISNYFFHESAKANGVDPSTIEFVYVGGTPELYAAITSGAADGVIISNPFTERAVAEGNIRLADVVDVFPDAPFQAIAMSSSWAAENEEAAVGFFKGFMESIAWFNDEANREAAAEILSEHTNADMEDSLASYDFYADKVKAFKNEPYIDPDVLDELLASMKDAGFFDEELRSSAEFINSSLVEAASGRS